MLVDALAIYAVLAPDDAVEIIYLDLEESNTVIELRIRNNRGVSTDCPRTSENEASAGCTRRTADARRPCSDGVT
jgi:hypothetical protein